jgi:hypothetical protein
MKKLLLSMMVLALVVACGKDNKVSSTNGAASNPITISDPTAITVGGLIDNYTTTFGTGQASYYDTWNTLLSKTPNVTYVYSKSSGSSNYSYCWFGKCSTNASVSREVPNTSVDITTKLNELKAIINRKSAFYPITTNGTAFTIITSDNHVYTIDRYYPVQANPVYIQTPTYREYLSTVR